ncbi:MAG: hypothetical protein PHY26_00370 [Bacilli bacterium]|jgi:hypothetical protein|nr:hypothetical protein [Bacilli bacterium]
MAKIKIIIISLLVILITGCRAEYHLNFDSNLNIEEIITMVDRNDTIINYAPNVNAFIDIMLEDLETSGLVDNRDIKTNIGVNETTGIGTAHYNSFNEYIEDNILIDNIFESMNITKDNNIITVKFKSLTGKYEIFIDDGLYAAFFDEAQLKIKIPFQVLNNNADYYEKETNTYVWEYNANVIAKDVDIVFDTKQPIKESIITSIKNLINNNGNFSLIMVIFILLFIIGIGGFFIIIKNKANNTV